MRPFLRLLFAFVLVAGCGDDTATLRVDVRTDYVPGVEFAEVEVGFDEAGTEVTYPVRFGEDFLRGVRVASLENAPLGQQTLRARLNAADGRRIAERRLALELSDDATTVTIVFTRACASVSCPDGDDATATQCVGGRCVRPECSPENPDACGEGCANADECPSDVAGCARAICDEGICYVGSELGACATREFCHPDRGCTPEPVETDGAVPMSDGGVPGDGGEDDSDMFVDASCGQPCDTGSICELGTFDCSSGSPVCTPSGPASAGTECRAAASGCDVAEECDGSSTACPTDEFAPTGEVCRAGFCDGLGECGDCEPGAACSTGNPCEVGTTVCTGITPACERASDVSSGVSCGSDSTGPWSSCGGFSNDCDTTGTQSRSVTTFECNGSGTCRSTASIEMRACNRVTNGDPCGAVREESGFGSCGGFTSICDETGTQSQTVTTYACNSAGSCIGSGSMESRSCNRDTDGTMCMPDEPGPWSGCLVDTRSDPCAESGMQTRTVTQYRCNSGSCDGMNSTESVGCSMDSNGRSCPSPFAPNFPCAIYQCDDSSNCVQSGDTCSGSENCCFSGCALPGGMELCFG